MSTILEDKQLEMRKRQLKLTPVEKYQIGRGWDKINKRRSALIDMEACGCASAKELRELSRLQRLADLRIRVYAPLALNQLGGELEKAKRRGRE